MKPCHENNGSAISVGRAATLHNPFTPQLNILTKMFQLASCSNTFQILLLFVQGQGQKGKQKHKTKLLSGFITIAFN